MNFTSLVQSIQQTHTALQQQANKAINRSLTIRNWLIGYYIVEYEQNGEDRAVYGAEIIAELAKKLEVKGLSSRNLHLFKAFYKIYPHIVQTVSAQLQTIGIEPGIILQTLSAKSYKQLPGISMQGTPSPVSPIEESDQTASDESLPEIGQTLPAQSQPAAITAAEKLISRLSFSHLVELFEINDPLKRAFYEIECMKGTWSVRELRRQVNSLYFERSGISKNPEKLSLQIAEKAETLQPTDIIKSVFVFEFLGLKAKDVVEENDLETALLDHLQQFLLEMGHGFCLEARQKKIVIGDEYFFIDLVFYHRILKCHVLVELKVEEFNHVNAGQLNTYLNYYKKEIAEPADNPPVGILLVTNKNEALVEYAIAGMDNKLFVSKYLVQLPSKEQLQQFVQNELKHL